MAEPAAVPPDVRDWTYVITEGCDECGFVPQSPTTTGERLRAAIPTWQSALAGARARERPAPTVWSVVEYGCHVRDASRIFRKRLELMLAQDDPLFANWDQDVTAIEQRYFEQDPQIVANDLVVEANAIATTFDGVAADQWARSGRRSNGSVFTVSTFAVYFLHDVEHHLHDIAASR